MEKQIDQTEKRLKDIGAEVNHQLGFIADICWLEGEVKRLQPLKKLEKWVNAIGRRVVRMDSSGVSLFDREWVHGKTIEDAFDKLKEKHD